MVDPTVVAASSAGKALASAVAKHTLTQNTRLGSPHERREVYSRFTEAVTRWSVLAQQAHLTRAQPFSGLRATFWAEMAEKIFAHQTELLIAYQEVHLVAPPEVLDRADAVLTHCGEVGELVMETSRSAEFSQAVEAAIADLRRFTLTVRVDLAYEPRWWQLWRTIPRSWRDRKERKAVERQARPELEAAG